jgi:hypothetical protein
MARISREKFRAAAWGFVFTALLAILIVVGSRNLDHFDAALVGYTFATLFAAFGITYRYAMWLQRPPTRLYWRRGWEVFLTPRFVGANVVEFLRRFFLEFAANRFIFRRGRLRGRRSHNLSSRRRPPGPSGGDLAEAGSCWRWCRRTP